MKSSVDGLGKLLMIDGFVPVEREEAVCEFRYGLAEYVARHLIQPFIASSAERRYLGKCQTRRKRDIAGIMRCEWNGVLG